MMHGFIPPQRYFPYLTWSQIEQMPNKENVVIIQPVGAIEQHGPHLPIAVDSAISLGVLGKALSKLDHDLPAYALPCLYYGKSNEHIGFPGTITLSAQTLLAVITEMALSIYRSGFRKLILMNSHGDSLKSWKSRLGISIKNIQTFRYFPCLPGVYLML